MSGASRVRVTYVSPLHQGACVLCCALAQSHQSQQGHKVCSAQLRDDQLWNNQSLVILLVSSIMYWVFWILEMDFLLVSSCSVFTDTDFWNIIRCKMFSLWRKTMKVLINSSQQILYLCWLKSHFSVYFNPVSCFSVMNRSFCNV